MYKLIYLLVIIVIVTGCATTQGKNNVQVCKEYEERLKQIESIDIEKGVGKDDAKILAQEYFGNIFGGCGSVGEPIDKNDYWGFEAVVGIVGIKMDELIQVNKLTGVVSMKEHTTIASKEYFIQRTKD